MEEKYWIGIDLGGTNIRVGLVDDSGTIHKQLKQLTEAEKGPDHVLCKLMEMIDQVKENHIIEAIGIGLPGTVNSADGVVCSLTNLPGWIDIPISNIITDRFQAPCFIENDGNVAALAEAVFGAGKEYSIVYYITVSTGIGGGLCINKEILSGATGNAGEIGNIIVGESESKHSYLNKGSLEALAAGIAIMRDAKEKGLNIKYANEVFVLAEEGNTDAMKIAERTIDLLARGMAAIASVVDPHIFVLGGGIALSVPGFASMVKEKYEGYIYANAKGKIKVELAKLDEPGIIGAMYMAKKRLNNINSYEQRFFQFH